MKVSKLLFLGVLASALCISGSASAQSCTAILADGLGPNGANYNVGETIEYVISLSVPASPAPPADPFCTLTEVSVYFFPPPGSGDSCAETGSGVLIATGLTLIPGAPPFVFTSADNGALAYEVTAADCLEPTPISASMATVFTVPGVPDPQCDEKVAVNTVNPIDPPECGILGRRTICEGDIGEEYCSEFPADSYHWEVSGPAVIDGPDDGECVLVDPTGSGPILLTLTVCTDNGDPDPQNWCCTTCETEVLIVDAPPCDIEGPPELCVDGEPGVYCAPPGADSYEWSIEGPGTILDTAPDGSCVLVGATGPGDFLVIVTTCNTTVDPPCCMTCRFPVTAVPAPRCAIDGPATVCQGELGVEYCAPEGADDYHWEVLGDAIIVEAPPYGPCIHVNVGGTGAFLVTLEVCNEVIGGPDGPIPVAQVDQFPGCCAYCEQEVIVEECGAFCSFTQGFWGNYGGKACDMTPTVDLIAPCLPITIGVDGRSITFPAGSEDCVIERLPAGGTPMPLPEGLGNIVDNCEDAATDLLDDAGLLKKGNKKNGRPYNNVLIGQVVALTLNLCVSQDCVEDAGDLATWVLQGEFCVVPYDDPDACPKKYTIPESLVGMSVQDLLDAANAALGGDDTYSIGDIYTAVTAINEGFDECATLVDCGLGIEICDNGCDDDYDGVVDEDDCVILDGD